MKIDEIDLKKVVEAEAIKERYLLTHNGLLADLYEGCFLASFTSFFLFLWTGAAYLAGGLPILPVVIFFIIIFLCLLAMGCHGFFQSNETLAGFLKEHPEEAGYLKEWELAKELIHHKE